MKINKFLPPLVMWLVFETIAVTLWFSLDNIFYLFNFSYIGTAIAIGLVLYGQKKKYARNIVQFAVGLYMLVYLGFLCRENMQIEGFWYYLFLGVFEAATIHYVIAKIFGPLLFGRGWCGYACWTAMVLDLLPFKSASTPVSPGELSDILFLRLLFCLSACFLFFKFRTKGKLCGGVLSLEIFSTMPLELLWPSNAETTEPFANTYVRLPFF